MTYTHRDEEMEQLFPRGLSHKLIKKPWKDFKINVKTLVLQYHHTGTLEKLYLYKRKCSDSCPDCMIQLRL